VPILGFESVDGAKNPYPRIVDQGVNFRTQFAQRVGEGFGHGVLVAHVAGEELETVVVQAFGGGAAPAGHGGPAGQQSLGGGAANAAAHARYDGNFPTQVHTFR